jgi:hypothetical protein
MADDQLNFKADEETRKLVEQLLEVAGTTKKDLLKQAMFSLQSTLLKEASNSYSEEIEQLERLTTQIFNVHGSILAKANSQRELLLKQIEHTEELRKEAIEEVRSEYEEKLSNTNEQLAQLKIKKDDLSSKFEDQRMLLEEQTIQLLDMQGQNAALELTRNTQNELLEARKKEIEELTATISSQAEKVNQFDALQVEFQALQLEMERMKAEHQRVMEKQVTETNHQIQKLQDDLQRSLEDKQQALDTQKEKLELEKDKAVLEVQKEAQEKITELLRSVAVKPEPEKPKGRKTASGE